MDAPKYFNTKWAINNFGNYAEIILLDALDGKAIKTTKEKDCPYTVKIIGVSKHYKNSGLAIQWADNTGHNAPDSEERASKFNEFYAEGVCGSETKTWFIYFEELKSFTLIEINKNTIAELIKKLEL